MYIVQPHIAMDTRPLDENVEQNPIAGKGREESAEYLAFYTGWQNSTAGLGLTWTSVIIQIKRNKRTKKPSCAQFGIDIQIREASARQNG